jgi:hypothetical protein
MVDIALGGGAGYACHCALGFVGPLCATGDTVFRHVHNPFMRAPVIPEPTPAQWKPTAEHIRPFKPLPPFVPPPPPDRPCCGRRFPITVGPGHVPNTETRTVTVIRPDGTARADLSVDVPAGTNWRPNIIRDARKHLRKSASTIEATHKRIRVVADAPLNSPMPFASSAPMDRARAATAAERAASEQSEEEGAHE